MGRRGSLDKTRFIGSAISGPWILSSSWKESLTKKRCLVITASSSLATTECILSVNGSGWSVTANNCRLAEAVRVEEGRKETKSGGKRKGRMECEFMGKSEWWG